MNSNDGPSSGRRSRSPTPSKDQHDRQGNKTFWSSGIEHGIKPPNESKPIDQN